MKRGLLILLTCLVCMLFFGCKSAQVNICDSQGNLLCAVDSRYNFQGDSRESYFRIVLEEAVDILAAEYDCDTEEAEKKLFSQAYTILTAFDVSAFQAMEAACKESSQTQLGCALTDLQGRLVASYSSDGKSNFASKATSPYSALKPLSVYAQAVEHGIAHWTTTYHDSPYKKVAGEDGLLRDWPSNHTNRYKNEDVYLYEALQTSLNTVAVKCLAEVGVDHSIRFLQEKLGMPLQAEQYALSVFGQEDLVGNIALGYLEDGVSPVDMAGYYQIFATGGMYCKPYAVIHIRDVQGNPVYTAKPESSRVIKETTAAVMNQLLQTVVSSSGTGADAQCQGIPVAGKTGTGEEFTDNWFIGVTPAYSCAVWHGYHQQSNVSPALFSEIMTAVHQAKPEATTAFYPYAWLEQAVICTESGGKVADNCTTITMGYYEKGKAPAVCPLHG